MDALLSFDDIRTIDDLLGAISLQQVHNLLSSFSRCGYLNETLISRSLWPLFVNHRSDFSLFAMTECFWSVLLLQACYRVTTGRVG